MSADLGVALTEHAGAFGDEPVARLDDEMLVNAIAQVAPFDVGAKQALLEEVTLNGRADLLVQLMQFHRMAMNGGVEMEPTLQ